MKTNYRIFMLLLSGMLLFSCQTKDRNEYSQIMGLTQGTTYHVTYRSEKPLKLEIDSLLAEFDTSLSTYNSESLITAINENRSDSSNIYLLTCIKKSIEVCEASDGAFDITIGRIANMWGFGFKNKEEVSQARIDSLLPLIGCGKIQIDGTKIRKSDPNIILNVNAIAQGYAVDVVCLHLDQLGISDYMVEIGGEVRVKGLNPRQEKWKVGINVPVDDSLNLNQDIQEVVKMSNLSLATSGNYRKFYVENGVKYSHTLNPKTGYPVKHNLLSASVISSSCMEADAYATAFMVLGLEKSMQLLKLHPELEAYFISAGSGDEYIITYSPGMKQHLESLENQ